MRLNSISPPHTPIGKWLDDTARRENTALGNQWIATHAYGQVVSNGLRRLMHMGKLRELSLASSDVTYSDMRLWECIV